MKEIDPRQVTERERYKLLSGALIPRPIAWTLTQNEETGSLNLAPFSFFTVLASEQPLVSLSVMRRRQDGAMKDTARNLVTAGEGVIHIVDRAHLEAMNQTAATLQPDESEVDANGLQTVASSKVKTPRLAEAAVAFEVKVKSHLPLEADDSQVMTDLFILEVVNFVFRDDLVDVANYHVDARKLDPISRLAGSNYGKLGEIISIERPK